MILLHTLTVFPAFPLTSVNFLQSLPGISFQSSFPLFCTGLARVLHLDSQAVEEGNRQERSGGAAARPFSAKAWQRIPGQAGGTWFTQDQHSWSSL